jgi:hypothetical protein
MHTGHVLEFSPLEKSKEARINDVFPAAGPLMVEEPLFSGHSNPGWFT